MRKSDSSTSHMITINKPVKVDSRMSLINELFEQSTGRPRCPHIRRDELRNHYCGKGLTGSSEISETRRMVCDPSSLQLYCLKGPEDIRFASIIKENQLIKLDILLKRLLKGDISLHQALRGKVHA